MNTEYLPAKFKRYSKRFRYSGYSHHRFTVSIVSKTGLAQHPQKGEKQLLKLQSRSVWQV